MSVKVNLLNSNSTFNITTNFERVKAALEDSLSRKGDLPNQMNTSLDMNGNDILNIRGLEVDNLIVNGEVIQTDIVGFTPINGSVTVPKLGNDVLAILDRIPVSVLDYGATGNGSDDDYEAIQACIDAVGLAGGGIVHIPAGTYNLSAGLLVARNHVYIQGDGIDNTILRPITNGINVVTFFKTGSSIEYTGISHLTIVPPEGVTVNRCIWVKNHYWCDIHHIKLPIRFSVGIEIERAAIGYYIFLNMILSNGGAYGLVLGNAGTGDLQNVYMTNCNFNGASVAGVFINNVGGMVWTGGETLYCQTGMLIAPDGSGVAKDGAGGINISGVFFDTCIGPSVLMNPTSIAGSIATVSFVNCSFNNSSSGVGLNVGGPSLNNTRVANIKLTNCSFVINREHGIYLAYVKDVDIIGCSLRSNGQDGTSSGLFIGDGVQGVRMIGGDSGGGDEFGSSQRYGVVVSANASQVKIISVDLAGNVTGPVQNNSSTLVVKDCEAFKTHSKGTGLIPTGQSSVNITHNLAALPAVSGYFNLNLVADLAASGLSRPPWVSAMNATTFTVNIHQNATTDFYFAWNVDSLNG